jgi:hypothetical protein
MAETANLALSGENRKFPERFLGSWSLVSFEHVPPSGEVLRPFGDSPTGLIVYQANGRMSVQISVGSRKKLACEDPFQASPEEASEAWRTYFGYWGSFAVDLEKCVVMHHVEGSSFSNWIGTEQVRYFRFDEGNRLILESQSTSGHSIVTWRRMSD